MPLPIESPDEVLSDDEFFKRLGLSRAMFYRRLSLGHIPPPPRLGRRRVVWTRSYLLRVQQALAKRKGAKK